MDRGQFDAREELLSLNAVALVKREVLERVGGMRSDYFAYYEETEWWERVKKAGYKLVYEPTAITYHRSGRATGGGRTPASVHYLVRNRARFIFEHVPKYYWPTAFGGWFAEVAARVFIYLIHGEVDLAQATLKGFKDFLRGRRGKSDYTRALEERFRLRTKEGGGLTC